MSIALSSATAGPPYSIHAEKIVLASMIRTPALIQDIQAVISAPSAFYGSNNERLFGVLTEVFGNHQPQTTRDLIEAVLELDDPKLQLSGGGLRSLAAQGEDLDGALNQARLVAEKSRMRGLIEALSDTLTDAYRSTDGFEAILGRAHERLDALAH